MAPKSATIITDEAKTRIHDILQSEFGRQVESISLQQGSNNTQVYTTVLSPIPANGTSHATAYEMRNTRSTRSSKIKHKLKPGTEELPVDTTTVILRFTNPGSDLNDAVQVQNEVAMYTLARKAFEPLDNPITPRIYGWQAVDVEAGLPGWILQEKMSGESLGDGVFAKLDRATKESIVADIARIFRLLQQFRLPDSVVGYGGLNFDDDGQVVIGPTAIHAALKGCATYHKLYNEYLQTQLRRMDECDIIQGWKDEPALRARIDTFVERGFPSLLERAADSSPRPVIVHGDFNIENLLYDPGTNRITALLDWSFSHIASLSDEYFYSFAALSHIVTHGDLPLPENTVRKALLEGLAAVSDKEKKECPMADWQLIEMTDAAFAVAGVVRPVDQMPNIDILADLYWFLQNVSQPMFFMPRLRAKMGPGRLKVAKFHTKNTLEQILKRRGY
ncbi:hypothetical protein SBRCBS47491_009699 [Sporothrix bragantina]|uniref:Aminoglycoside phosphotransferase domain-containing protein n=1 Tax=Sporothrix bragantina TaxID=671064 RepID=A0ABP0D026_9PEZI